MNRDMTDLLYSLKGADFVTAVRALAIMSKVDDGFLRCGGCRLEALYIGMQRCGAPGGPVCNGCLELHRHYLDVVSANADCEPYCRHCEHDIDRGHIYAVNIWTGQEVAV